MKNSNEVDILYTLNEIIKERSRCEDCDSSYVASLMKRGTCRCAQKFGEEAVELVISVSSNSSYSESVGEAADVLFHYMVLLQSSKIEFSHVLEELVKRNQQK